MLWKTDQLSIIMTIYLYDKCFNCFNQLLCPKFLTSYFFNIDLRRSRDETVGLDDKGGVGEGRRKGKAMEYRGGKNGGGEWRVGWDVNASWDGSLLPVSGKCMAIVAMFHVPSPPPFSLRTLGSPSKKFSLSWMPFTILNPEKSPWKFLFCANNNNIIHGVSHVSKLYFWNFLSSFIFLFLFYPMISNCYLQIN